MKKNITIAFACLAISSFSQDMTFNNIHKLVDAKKYRTAITELKAFIKTDNRHVSAHYDLANCYRGLLDSLAKIQNANVKNQNSSQWGEKEYKDNLNFWTSGIGVTDSAIMYLKETSELINIKFLTLDLRYNDLYEATKDCGVVQKVKCARNYLGVLVERLEKVNADNKSNLFNEQKNYEAFKGKGEYVGVYELQMDEFHEAGGEIRVKYSEGKYFAESTLGSSTNILKNFTINSGSISFYLEDYFYKGTILSNPDKSVVINVETKNDKMKFIRK